MPRKPRIDPEEQQAALLELFRREPSIWRNNLLVDGPSGTCKWGDILCPVQKQDFAALDPALKFTGRIKEWDGAQWVLSPKPEYQRFWIQRSRGYSKSTDIASCILWLIAFAQRKIEGVIAAEDQEQAEFVRDQMQELLQYNEWMREILELKKHALTNKITHSEARFITSDAKSSFGAKPHFTLATEFTHWSNEKFWSAVFSSAAKTFDKGGLLILDCNAGEGSGWQYKVKQHAQTQEEWYHHAPPGHAPWYSEGTIQEQAGGLSLQEYRRLWWNEWQASDGEFVSLEEADACVDLSLSARSEGQTGFLYVAALDYAEKEDPTAAVVGHLYDGHVIVDRMDSLDPKMQSEGIVRIDWVEQWMRNVQAQFGNKGAVQFIVDPWQLIGTIQTLESEGFDIERFEFSGGRGNYEISDILRKLILHKRVRWYDGCGQLTDKDGRLCSQGQRNDLSTELACLIRKKQSGTRRWRFDHIKGQHDDRAFVLGLLCHYIVNNSVEQVDWGNVIPSKNGKPNF